MNRTLACLVGIGIGLGALGWVGVTGAAPEQPTEVHPAAASREHAPPAPTGDIDFPGGTLGEYLAAVAKAFGSANAAVEPGAESARLAPVTLRQVQQRDAILLVGTLSGQDVEANVTGPVAHIQSARRSTASVRVWSMGSVLLHMPAEQALSAVRATLDLVGEGAVVRFHEDSGLLMVRGSPEQLGAVDDALEKLHAVADLREREAQQGRHDAGVQALMETVTSLKTHVEKAIPAVHQRIDALAREIDDVRKR